MFTTNRISGFLTAILVLASDLWSKQSVLSWFYHGSESIEVTSFLNVILAFNRGVSFGMFHADSPMVSMLS